MIALPPIVPQLIRDPSVGRSAMRVLLELTTILDVVDYRPAPLAAIAAAAGMAEPHVSDALRCLCERGYLLRGQRTGGSGGGAWTYRIPHSCAVPQSHAA
jgi:hypothetical protein